MSSKYKLDLIYKFKIFYFINKNSLKIVIKKIVISINSIIINIIYIFTIYKFVILLFKIY